MPSPRLLIVGLVGAIAANILIVVMAIAGTLPHLVPAGNLTAAIVCLAAIWIVRNRARFRDQ